MGFFLFSSLSSLSLSISRWCVLNQAPHGGATLLLFVEKINAWGTPSLISTALAKTYFMRFIELTFIGRVTVMVSISVAPVMLVSLEGELKKIKEMF